MNLLNNLWRLPKFDFYFAQPLDIDEQISWLYKEKGYTIGEIVEDLCYDRGFCESKGIDYCNITSKDILKIREYIIKTLNS